MIFIVCKVQYRQVQVGTWHTMHLTLPVREKAIEAAKKYFNMEADFDDVAWLWAYNTCDDPRKVCFLPNRKGGPIVILDQDRT